MDQRRVHLVYEVVIRAERGDSIRSISKALKVSRPTVRAILKQEKRRRAEGETVLEAILPPRRTPRACKLDTYVKQITAWLDQFPDLTAVRLLEKLHEIGFDGGYTIVRIRLNQLRAEKKPKVAVEIVETSRGQQGQFDWSPFEIENGIIVRLWSYTLSWSRAQVMEDSLDQRQPSIFRCLQHSFEVLEGVPAESVTDSMPGVVDRWECGKPILNVRFVDFAAYYCFVVHIAPRGDGAYKGKVERNYRYARENLMNGRTFYSVAQFHETLVWWLQNESMQRPHPVTGRPLHEMLQEERSYLKPLPRKPYDIREVVFRLVAATGYFVHETNQYRVPDEHIGEWVYVCVSVEQLEVYDGGVHLVAQHLRFPDGAKQRTPSPSHKRRYDLTLLVERMSTWGETAADFANRMKARRRCAGAELAHIIDLQTTWSADDIVAALEHAMKYDAYDPHAIERILQARFTPRTLEDQVAQATRERVRETMKEHPVQIRSLSYPALRQGDLQLGRQHASQEEEHEHGQDTEGLRTGETDQPPIQSPDQGDDVNSRTTRPQDHDEPTGNTDTTDSGLT